MHALAMVVSYDADETMDSRCGVDFDYYDGFEGFDDVTIGGEPLSKVKEVKFVKEHLDECCDKFTMLVINGVVVQNLPKKEGGMVFSHDEMKRIWESQLAFHQDDSEVMVYDIHI